MLPEEQEFIIKILFTYHLVTLNLKESDESDCGGLHCLILEGKEPNAEDRHLSVSFFLDLFMAGSSTWQLRRKKSLDKLRGVNFRPRQTWL